MIRISLQSVNIFQVADGFDRLINWLELGHVDFSPASFYRALNYNQYP